MKKKPIDSTWTDEQWEAIMKRNTSILVSAGAGSGKTAVLTERILERLKEGNEIQDLIVLTFTNAAAKEMKERVKQKLLVAVKNGYPELQKELEQINLANICTFDSFSLNLVKKYHYLLGIENDVKIGDSVLMTQCKKECIKEAMNEFYESENPLFLKLLDTYTVKDDTKIVDILLNLANALTSRIHIEEELHKCNTVLNPETIQSHLTIYLKEIRIQIQELYQQLQQLEQENYSDKFHSLIMKCISMIEGIVQEEDYETYAPILQTIKLPSLPRSKEIDPDELEVFKIEYEKVKKRLEKIKDFCVYPTESEYIEEVLKTGDTVSILKDILLVYFQKLVDRKKEMNCYEFHDIGRFAIQILEEHDEIKKDYQNRIFEIMIDEYQDTNDIGTYFVSMIQNNNVYTVGDVKQSIYRFRNANPNIFMERFYQFQKQIGGHLITMSKNFRSRKEVVDAINFIFQAIMDEQVGGVHYHNQEEMIFGNLSYEKVKDEHTNYDMEVLDYPYKMTEYQKKYRKEEIEAFLIATDIKKRIQNQEMINDHGKLRPVTYSDFAILQDRKSSFELYKTIFTYLEVPIVIHKEEPFRESDIIYTIKSILKLIQCMMYKKTTKEECLHAFLSVSRSFLGGIKDDVIFGIIKHAGDENKTIFQVMEETPDTSDLYRKLYHLKEYGKTHTIYALLKEIYHTFQIYDAMIQLGFVINNSDKLAYLLNMTETLEQNGYDLTKLITYFDTMEEETIDVAFNMNPDSSIDAVTLMTIHKSKGLEFPICYFSGLTKSFSKADIKEKFLYHKDYGMIVPFYEDGVRETFYKKLFSNQNTLEDISERIRVFYVALTRAKEKIIFVAPLSDVNKNEPFIQTVPVSTRKNYHSFFDMLASIKELLTPYMKTVDLDKIPLTHDYDILEEEVLDKKMYSKISNLYQIQEEKKAIETSTYSNHSKDTTLQDIEKMKLGTSIHEYLEHIDFHNFAHSLESIPASSFIKEKISALMDQPFMHNIMDYNFYQEYEFIHTKGLEESVGIIDLLLVSDTCAIIVDYKLKEIHKKEYEKQVKGYMDYIHHKLNIPVKGYLYSILDEAYLEVE